MAENIKQLRRRIRTVNNVRQITRAMEMVSAARLRRAQQVLMAGRPYTRKIQELLGRLADTPAAAGNPFFESRDIRRTTLVVFTSDRGLAGSFNNNLIAAAEAQIKRRGAEGLELVCVGRKGNVHFHKRPWPILHAITDLSGRIDPERSNQLAEMLAERFLSGQTDEVLLLYSQYISASTFRPTVERYLSLSSEAIATEAGADGARSREVDYIFEPSAREVFEVLVPRYLKAIMYLTFAEQFTSEHSARMLAMHSATKNCEDLHQALTLRMNKARQAAITKELLDIVGGAEALQG